MVKKKIEDNGIDLEGKSAVGRILSMMKKEFQIFTSDKINFFIVLLLPPLVLVAFSLQVRGAAPPLPINIMVVSNDSNEFVVDPSQFTEHELLEDYLASLNLTGEIQDNYTMPFIEALNNTEGVALVRWINATENSYAMVEARDALFNKEVNLVVVIPTGFSEMLNHNLPGILDAIMDTSNPLVLTGYLNRIQAIVNNFKEENDLSPHLNLEIERYFTIGDTDFSQAYSERIIMFLPFIIFGICMVLTILVVVQERPIARLLLTPLARTELLTSKFLTYGSIMGLQIGMVLGTTISLGLVIEGSLFQMIFLLLLIGYSAMSLGILVSVISTTKTEANQYFFLLLIVIVLLSGLFIPLDGMPDYLRYLAYLTPLCHGSPLLNQVIAKGIPFSVTDVHFTSLVLISVGQTVLSFVLMARKRYEV